MNSIVQETIGYAPNNLSKTQLAKWIHAKWRISWDEAHYHALHCVLLRVESRIKEMFVSLLGEEPNDLLMRELFERSLSSRYDYVTDFVAVPRLNQSVEELILSNIDDGTETSPNS